MLENENTVQTPIVNDVEDENPVWFDPEQISKYRSHVGQGGADNICRERVVPKNVKSLTTQLLQSEATRSVLEGKEI